MNYQSTRGAVHADAAEAILRGIAADGGLFVDPSIAERPFDWRRCLSLSALDMQSMLLKHLLPDIPDMDALVRRAYAGKFETGDLTPLVRLGADYVLELFRGPTAAFKDVALSMLPQLVAAAKEMRGDGSETVVLTATSGDTGKAALEGFHDVPGTRIFVFYPHGGVSAIQRAQMVTQEGRNVTVCAVRGNFDDCQTGVKKAFAALAGDETLKARAQELTSANSINIGRLAPQLVYYFIAYTRLVESGRIRPGDKVDYVVPTGNFGDILAGWMAKQLGLPVGKLVCASNANRVLTDFFRSGVYDRRRDFYRTVRPAARLLPHRLALDGHSRLVQSRASALLRLRRRLRAGAPLHGGAGGGRLLPLPRRDDGAAARGFFGLLLHGRRGRGGDRPSLARGGLSL